MGNIIRAYLLSMRSYNSAEVVGRIGWATETRLDRPADVDLFHEAGVEFLGPLLLLGRGLARLRDLIQEALRVLHKRSLHN